MKIIFCILLLTSGSAQTLELSSAASVTEAAASKLYHSVGDRISSLKRPLRPSSLLSQISLPFEEYSEEEALRKIIRKRLSAYKEEVLEVLDLSPQEERDSRKEASSLLTTSDLDAATHSRRKRATITADNPLLLGRRRRKIPNPLSSEYSYVILSVFRMSPQYFDHVRTLDINAVVIRNQTYMFTLELKKTQRTEVALYLVGSSLHPKEISRVEVPGATSLEVIKIGQYYYVLPLVYNWTASNAVDPMDVGSNLYKVDLMRRTLVKVQTIRTTYARTSVFWQGSGEEANDIYLAVAPSYQETARGPRFRVSVPCYRWQGGYFDYVSSIPAWNPQGIRYFNIFSHDYLVVSNYQDDSGSTNIHSEVFKYHHKESRFISFQRIRTFGAKDIQHFSFTSGQREEHFLAVANHCQKDENGKSNYRVKSFIMKFASQRFIPFKSFYTYGALQFQPVTLGSKFYLVLLEIKGIRLFQYNGWSFVQTFRVDFPELKNPSDSIKLRPFLYENQPYFAVSSRAENYQGGLYAVTFSQKNDHNEMTSMLEKWCLSARTRMQSVNVSQLEEAVEYAPKTDQPEIRFAQPLNFQGDLDINQLNAKEVKYRGVNFDSDLAQKLSSIQEQVENLQGAVNKLEKTLENVVFRNKNHEISGKIIFDKIEYYNNRLETVDSKFGTLNGYNVEKLLKNLIYTNQDYNFSSLQADRIEFKESLKTSQLNGSPLSDFGVKSSGERSQIFTRKNTFLTEVTTKQDVNVKGLLAGVDFHNPNFLLAQGNQTFAGGIRIEGTNLEYLYTKYLNGEEVDYYLRDAVPIDGDSVITGHKTFKNVTVDNLHAGGLINGFNIDELYSDAIYLKGRDYQTLHGKGHFQHLETEEVTLERKLVNEKYNLEKDFVNVFEGTFHLGDVTLNQEASVDELIVNTKLNSFEVVDGELDIVLKSSTTPQRIKNKRVSKITFEKDVTADGLVDSVNLKDWTHIHRIELKHNRISKPYKINGYLKTGDVKVRRKFYQKEYDILSILKQILPLNATRFPGNFPITFESLKVEGNTEIRKDINGLYPNTWVRKGYPGTYDIKGRKDFYQEVELEQSCKVTKGLYASGEIGAENIFSLIPNLLIHGMEQTISGHSTFTGDVKIDKLDCPNIILDGIGFENLFLKSGYQEIDVETYFDGDVSTEQELFLNGNLDVRSVNGIRLKEAIENTLRTGKSSEKQVIQGVYTFNGGLYAEHMENDGYVGGYDLGKLFSSIVMKNRQNPLHIPSGVITFQKGVNWPTVEYSNDAYLNGISSYSWGKEWLLNSGNQTIYTRVEFLDSLKVDEGLYVNNGYVNDLDLMHLSKNILKTNEEGYLGHVEFESDVKVRHRIGQGSEGKVNGIDLRKDVLLKDTGAKYKEQVVTGEKTFDGGWTIDGSLNVKQLDELDLSALFEFLFNRDAAAFQNSVLVIAGNMKLLHEPQILHEVNGKNLKELLNHVWFINKDAVIKEKHSFSDLEFKNGGGFSKTESLLSGINLNELGKNYVSKGRHQTWLGNVQFLDDVSFENLKVRNLLVKGLFNGVDLHEFSNSILLNGTDQVISGEMFFDNLYSNKIYLGPGVLINGVDISKDLMSIKGENKVAGNKRIGYLHVNVIELGYDTTLDGVNLTDWQVHSIKKYGNYEFKEPLEFENFEGGENIIVDGYVDGVKLDRDHILLKNGSQRIEGKMKIKSDENYGQVAALTAPHGLVLNGTFNNYDLNATFSSLVRKSEEDTSPLVIEGEKVFLSPIRVDHIQTERLYQGLNLTQLFHDFYSGLIIPHNLTFKARERYEALNNFTQQVLHISTQGAVFLEYFVLTQEIVEKSVYSSILYGTRFPTIVLGSGEGKSNAVAETWWSYSVATDYYQKSLGDRFRIQGEVVDYKEVNSLEHGHFIVVSVSNVSPRPANLVLDAQKSDSPHYEINKGLGKTSKTFVVKSVVEKGSSTKYLISQIIYSKKCGGSETFVIFKDNRLQNCLLLVSKDSLKSTGEILCLGNEGYFIPMQSIPLEYPSLTASMEVRNRTLLMLLTKGEGDEAEGVLQTWSHSVGDDLFSKESCIPIYNGISMDALFGFNSNPFLVVASGPVPSTRYSGAVFIYRYSMIRREWDKMQTLEIDSPIKVQLLKMKPSAEVFLFVLTQNVVDNILVYKYQGLSGWSVEHKWSSEGGKDLQVAHFQMDGTYHAHILVTGQNSTRIYSAEFKGLSAEPQHQPKYDLEQTI